MSRPYFVRINEIANLKDRYRVWKIHMLGDLTTNYASGEMNIDVWMVPLIKSERFKDEKNYEQMIENQYYDFSQSKQVKVGIGQLPSGRLISSSTNISRIMFASLA